MGDPRTKNVDIAAAQSAWAKAKEMITTEGHAYGAS